MMCSKRIYVLLPYKFTLLSNWGPPYTGTTYVLLPYKFTLLSNAWLGMPQSVDVLLPYKFTLLSNSRLSHINSNAKFYYPINLHYSQTVLDT